MKKGKMNKTILTSIIIFMSLNLYSGEKDKYLNEMIDKYIKINLEINKKSEEDAKETKLKKSDSCILQCYSLS